MQKSLFTILSLAALLSRAVAVEYKAVPNWYQLPEGRAQIGPMHGDVAVSSGIDIRFTVETSLQWAAVGIALILAVVVILVVVKPF